MTTKIANAADDQASVSAAASAVDLAMGAGSAHRLSLIHI